MPGNEQQVRYSYAKTAKDELVHVCEASRKQKYLCPGCNEPMIPVLGEYKAKHFRHLISICSYESYLHQTAKMAIYHRLLNEVQVPLKLMREVKCRSDQAALLAGHYEPCNMLVPAFYNLKALFDQVALEQYDAETGLKPDVLLTYTSSQAKCYIEIYVSSPCSAEKISSGVPILEFYVTSEADITLLLTGELSAVETNLNAYNFKPAGRVVERCLDQCKHAQVEIDTWKLSATGRLQKQTIRYLNAYHLDINTSNAWPKSLAPQEQQTRLKQLIQKTDPANIHANCVSCIYATNWDDGFLYCNKKHLKVPYTEAKLCAQYRHVK